MLHDGKTTGLLIAAIEIKLIYRLAAQQMSTYQAQHLMTMTIEAMLKSMNSQLMAEGVGFEPTLRLT